MLVQVKWGDDPNVVGPHGKLLRLVNTFRKGLDVLPALLYGKPTSTFYPGWLPSGIPSRVMAISPDLVHLHWVAGATLTPGGVARLRRPLVWTLHDMWPFTGGCHYDDGCGRHTARCGQCPLLGSTRLHDLSLWNWRRKRRHWHALSLMVISPSRWLAVLASRSTLLGEHPVRVIPNCIDTARYRPLPRAQARDSLGLPQRCPLILFGAMNATADPRKGYRFLQPALARLASQWRGPGEGPMALVFGGERPATPPDFGMRVRYLGALSDDASLAAAYSAADVFVAPSTQENLSNMVMEALACGTPSVAFEIGGMPDLIEHRVNGYLASSFDPEDLSMGIQWVIEDARRWKVLSHAARTKVESTFALAPVAQAHVEVYREAIELHSRRAGTPHL